MPSIRYANQSAPFWDFIASLEDQGASHPFFAGQNRGGRDSSDEETPWGWGWGWPHRGWHRGPPPFGAHPPHPPHPPHPHPPHPPHHGPEGPPPEKGGPAGEHEGPEREPPAYEGPGEGPSHDRRRDHHGPRGHGRCGGRRGFGRGRWGPQAGPWNMGGLADFIQGQMFGQNEGDERADDFKPDVDVFDTESTFVVHASLPGAKKEDIAVNWDPEKSELSISGVVYRPGDEEFLKTLAMDERKIGAFERKVRLGSRANPAHCDADGITAKLEEGILVVTVPKLDKDYVEVKKVDIE